MFGLFKKKSALERLEDKYDSLIAESFKLSTSNRAESDKVRAEAEKIAEEIKALESKK